MPLYLIEITYSCSNEQYAAVMMDFMKHVDSEPLFPLWVEAEVRMLEEMPAGGLPALPVLIHGCCQ